jgi:hypothetical protein
VGFRAREVMRGYHEFADGGPSGRHPFVFRATWGPDRLRDWIDPRKPTFLWQRLDGEVLAGALCDWTPCAGTLHLQYWPQRRIRYTFEFEVEGVRYRYLGDKVNLRLWNLAVSHTTCTHVLTEQRTGRLVATGVTQFRLRDLPALLTPGWVVGAPAAP